MVTTRAALTEDDIRTLVRGADPAERALSAHKICHRLDERTLSDQDRQRAEDVVRLIAADADAMVRRALSVTLKTSPLIPRDVANQLARDVDSIALPILAFSPTLTDDDLLDILEISEAASQVAIARRPQVSARISGHILQKGCLDAATAVCANDNAVLAPPDVERGLVRFSDAPTLTQTLCQRRTLPLEIAEHLITLVSEQMRTYIVEHHQVSAEVAMKVITGLRDRTTTDLVQVCGQSANARQFAQYLNREQRLTPSLILRCLARGYMTFFESALAEMTDLPHHRIWLLVHDAGPLGFKSLYERAGLPPRIYEAFRLGLDIFHQTEAEALLPGSREFGLRMTERFLSSVQSAPPDDILYLLDCLDRGVASSNSNGNAALAVAVV